ncbi:MAG: hypothetical protein ACREVJ_13000, partial [Gammaproteobacteria bacterium]
LKKYDANTAWPLCCKRLFTKLDIAKKEEHRAMSGDRNPKTDPGQPIVYEIRVKGHLDPRWTDWFGGMTITPTEGGDTLLTGQVVDQAALHGLLRKVRDLGMPLISAIRVKPP